MDQEKIGKLIKKIRKENKLTQAEFAEKYNVTYQAVSKWENGKNMPDLALIKKISKDFNIDIKDVLEGKITKKKRGKVIYISVILLLLISIGLIIHKEENFSFKTLSSRCSNFNLTGSIAYNNKKSSIYISDINYCGKENDEEYKKLECILYESNSGKENIISKYEYSKEEPIKLDEFLKTLNFKIKDYDRKCKKYTKDSLYLIINAKEVSGKSRQYKIPVSLDDNC